MRILLSAPWSDLGRTPASRLPRQLAEGLARRGHDVHLLTSGFGRRPDRLTAASAPIEGLQCHHVDPRAGARPAGPPYGPILQRQWQRAAAKAVEGIDRRGAIDVIHHLSPSRLFDIGWLPPRLAPTVLGPLRGAEAVPASFARYLGGDRRGETLRRHSIERLLPHLPGIRRALADADVVLGATPESVELVGRLGARRAVVQPAFALPNTLPFVDRIEPEPEDALRVLWMGPLLVERCVALALEMVAEVDVRVGVHLRVIGGIPAGDRVERLMGRPGMFERVEPLGPMGLDDQAKLLADCDVVVSTALRSTDGVDQARAMAAGVPLVALDHHIGAHLLADGGGVLLPVTRPAAAIRDGARALGELYLDRAHAGALGAEARHQAPRFMVDAVVGTMERLYAEVTMSGGGR